MAVGEIWNLIEKWYIDNGYLSYIESTSGKPKADWCDSPIKGDRLVKGSNQITARILELFPKAKRVVLGNNSRVLRGIGIIPSLVGDEGQHNQLPNQSHSLEVLPNNQSNQPNQLADGKNLEADFKNKVYEESKTESPPPIDGGSGYVASTDYVANTQSHTQRETQPHNQINEGGYDNEQTGYVSSHSTPSRTDGHPSLKVGDKVRTTRYPREVAKIIEVNGNNIRIEHPYGYEWVLSSEIIEVES